MGTDPDWFKVTINGYDHNNKLMGSKEVYLADFRFADSSKIYSQQVDYRGSYLFGKSK